MSRLSTHRHLQLAQVMDACEAIARINFRCARHADFIRNRSAAALFRARATKALRVANLAALRIGA
jgi:hypothetical protein